MQSSICTKYLEILDWRLRIEILFFTFSNLLFSFYSITSIKLNKSLIYPGNS